MSKILEIVGIGKKIEIEGCMQGCPFSDYEGGCDLCYRLKIKHNSGFPFLDLSKPPKYCPLPDKTKDDLPIEDTTVLPTEAAEFIENRFGKETDRK